MASGPQVVTGIGLADFIQDVLDNNSRPSTLVVCAAEETFIEQLLAACIETRPSNINEQQSLDGEPAENEPVLAQTHDLLKRLPLFQLANSRTVKLVFCHDLTHLRAYLATLAIPKTASEPNESNEPKKHGKPLLAILNPIDIHRFTTAFSAQGLNRTFSLAVEAAHATRNHLFMIEFPGSQHREADQTDVEYELRSQAVSAPPLANPWDEEVSILNVTTKSFGAGGRGWVGRTVTIRRIAERWCVFSVFQRKQGEVVEPQSPSKGLNASRVS
jgi:hypothetical protein